MRGTSGIHPSPLGSPSPSLIVSDQQGTEGLKWEPRPHGNTLLLVDLNGDVMWPGSCHQISIFSSETRMVVMGPKLPWGMADVPSLRSRKLFGCDSAIYSSIGRASGLDPSVVPL